MAITMQSELGGLIGYFVFIFFVMICAKALTFLLKSTLEHFEKTHSSKINQIIIKTIISPIYLLILLFGLKIGGEILDLTYFELQTYNSFLNFCIAITLAYFLVRMISKLMTYYFKSCLDPAEKVIDFLGLKIIEKIAAIFIFVFILLIYLTSIGIDTIIISLFTLILFTGYIVVSTWFLIEIASYITLIHQEKIKKNTILEFKEAQIMGTIISFKLNKIYLEDEYGNEILIPASYLRTHAFRIIKEHKTEVKKQK